MQATMNSKLVHHTTMQDDGKNGQACFSIKKNEQMQSEQMQRLKKVWHTLKRGITSLSFADMLSNVLPRTRSQRTFERIFRISPSAVVSRLTTSWSEDGGA